MAGLICYSYVSASLTQPSARATCQAMGGDLVKYTSLHDQLRVEGYFSASGALSQYSYWLGVQRDNGTSDYAFTYDGSPVPQAPGGPADPYGHWNWHQQTAASTPGYDCVLALGAYTYSYYLGDNSTAQQADPAYYQTAAANLDRTMGWSGYSCLGKHQSVCMLPDNSFACSPPPSPPPVPPSPSPPPSPPYPPTCAPTFGPAFFCDPTVTRCYSSSGDRTANYTVALQRCQAQGGSLAAWSSAEEQLMAEQYFRSQGQGSLPKYYWLGIRRLAPGSPYQRVADNGSLPQLATGPSSPGAYAHWAWLQPAYSALPTHHCGLAWVDLAYGRWVPWLHCLPAGPVSTVE